MSVNHKKNEGTKYSSKDVVLTQKEPAVQSALSSTSRGLFFLDENSVLRTLFYKIRSKENMKHSKTQMPKLSITLHEIYNNEILPPTLTKRVYFARFLVYSDIGHSKEIFQIINLIFSIILLYVLLNSVKYFITLLSNKKYDFELCYV